MTIKEIEMYKNKLKPKSMELGGRVHHGVAVTQEDIKEILHWYKDEFLLVKDAIFRDNELMARVGFSHYPFVQGEMPFVSSNLINIAADQCALVHFGMMIKYNSVSVIIVNNEGIEKAMSFEEYNLRSGDEFLTAKLKGRYNRPVPPSQEVKICSQFLGMKRTSNGRYILDFQMRGEEFFTVAGIFAYPMNLSLIGR